MSKQGVGAGGRGASRAGPDGQEPPVSYKEKISNMQTSKNAINRQREYEIKMGQLSKEFGILDLDNDGMITQEELQAFLDAKVSC